MDWNTTANIATGLGTIGAVVIACFSLRRKNEVAIQPQPVKVEITEELHEQFADKEAFEKLVSENTGRHSQIFHRIDAVAAEMRARDESIKDDVNEKFSSIQRLLGRIEQKIDSK